MREFMREKIGHGVGNVWVKKRARGHAVIAGFVMLDAIGFHVVALGKQKIVVAIVARAEDCAGFRNELAPFLDCFGSEFETRFGFCCDVNVVLGFLSRRQINGAHVRAHQNRRIDECGEACWLKLDCSACFACDRQSGSEFPSGRYLQSG